MCERKWKLIVDYTGDRGSPLIFSYYTYLGVRLKLRRLKDGWTSCAIVSHDNGVWIIHDMKVKDEGEYD